MQLVVNEWLPEYFRRVASREEQLSLQQFIQRFIERGDQLLVRRPSPFLDKINRYAKELNGNDDALKPLRDFIKLVLLDTKRCIFIDDSALTLPDDIEHQLTRPQVPPLNNFESDRYLFEAAIFGQDRVIVSTDLKLIKAMEGASIQVVELSDFLKTY